MSHISFVKSLIRPSAQVKTVDTALDLARTKRLEDGRNAVKKRVGPFLVLEAPIELLGRPLANRFEKGLARPVGHFGAYQDSDFFKRLPLPVEGE